MMFGFNHRTSRPFTHALIEAVEQGMFNKDTLISDLLGWMSESDVEQFVRANDLLEAVGMAEEDEEEDDPLDNFNYVGSRHHY
jgi:hypothetical protein